VMIFAVLSSTVATTQTTLLPAARITYAMARDGVFPKLFGSIHSRYLTPAVGTVVLAFISLFGIMLTTFSASSSNVFNNLVNNIGVLVAFYYGITGIACAWAFRKTLGHGWRPNLTMIFLPLVGGVALLFVCYQVIKSGGSTTYPDIIVLALGLPLLLIAMVSTRGKSGFFKQPLVSYESVED
jgi:amino acid transporter